MKALPPLLILNNSAQFAYNFSPVTMKAESLNLSRGLSPSGKCALPGATVKKGGPTSRL
jgi:hypothetical protein